MYIGVWATSVVNYRDLKIGVWVQDRVLDGTIKFQFQTSDVSRALALYVGFR